MFSHINLSVGFILPHDLLLWGYFNFHILWLSNIPTLRRSGASSWRADVADRETLDEPSGSLPFEQRERAALVLTPLRTNHNQL